MVGAAVSNAWVPKDKEAPRVGQARGGARAGRCATHVNRQIATELHTRRQLCGAEIEQHVHLLLPLPLPLLAAALPIRAHRCLHQGGQLRHRVQRARLRHSRGSGAGGNERT